MLFSYFFSKKKSMQKKIALSDEIEDYSRLAQNELKRKSLDSAGDIIQKMGEKWPDSEEYILLNIQYLASLNRGDEISEFVSKTENGNVYLSSKTKEALAFWAN